MFLVYLWNTIFFWNFELFHYFSWKWQIPRLKLIKKVVFWKIHPFFGGVWGFGPSEPGNSQDTANAGNLGGPGPVGKGVFSKCSVRNEGVPKNAHNPVFSRSQPQISDKKLSKIVNFLLKIVFFRLTCGEYSLLSKKYKKETFPSFGWEMGDNFSNHFFRKNFLLNFFQLEKLMFFWFCEIFWKKCRIFSNKL